MGNSTAFFPELAVKAGVPDRLMIDATDLKAHHTAVSLLKKGMFPGRTNTFFSAIYIAATVIFYLN